MIKAGQDTLATDFIVTVVAGEALSARDAVYIDSSDGKAYKTDSDDLSKIDFIGFAQEAATLGGNVNIINNGVATGFSGLTAAGIYYLSGTAGAITTTPPTNAIIVGVALSTTVVRILKRSLKIRRTYTTIGGNIGSSTTQFDITNPSGTTFRYTYDGTGTDPSINSGTFPIGSAIVFKAQNFNAANKGVFIVTGVGSNYVEVTNASGVVESNKTIGTGYVRPGTAWTKPKGILALEIEMQGAGGSGGGGGANTNDRGSGGGEGGYVYKYYTHNQLNSIEGFAVGNVGEDTMMGTALLAGSGNGGTNATSGIILGGDGGTATGGDINVTGRKGYNAVTYDASAFISGRGQSSRFGCGGKELTSGGDGNAATGYGAGGGGGWGASGNPRSAGSGTQAIIILTEYY